MTIRPTTSALQATCVVMVLAVLSPFTATAVVVDLLTLNNEGYINGALYQQGRAGAGSGVFETLYRVSRTGTERGYNTGGTPEFDTSKGINLQLSQMPVQVIQGFEAVIFPLDVNESQQYISLDTVEVYVSDSPDATGYATGGLGTKVYDMDAGEDSTVLLDYSLEAGSGRSDMFLYLPSSLFSSFELDDYVYLYSEFGGFTGTWNGISVWTTDDGFDEWAWISDSGNTYVPEPGALHLLALLLSGALLRRRRRAAC